MYLNVKLGQPGGHTQESSAVQSGQQIETQEHLCSKKRIKKMSQPKCFFLQRANS